MQPILAKFPAERLVSFLAILFVIGLQLVFFFMPQSGPNPYRAHERMVAFKAWHQNPSTATKAASDHEFQLEHHHDSLMGIFVFMPFVGLLVFVDVIVLYIYWRRWVRTVPTNPAPEPN